ncbi:tetratricopeptide repeat protein [Erythrobacter sp. MTPC3]|uniref:tetratricopeptide repeat protein n=1 Tax=Erythrobacter sp. MTPC3 TaxID=3056564 RepID=UPI0036F324B1
MKRVCSILLLAPLALLGACGLAPEEKLAEAHGSLAEHDYTGAKVYLVSALKDLPGDTDVLVLLAKTQIAMGDGDGALASLDQIDRQAVPAGSNDQLSSLRAEAELLRGNFTKALDQLGEPANADTARIAALAMLGLGEVAKARSAVEADMELPGNKAGLLAVLARIQLGEGDVDSGQETAQAALRADPENIDALLASAAAARTAYDIPAALDAFETASALYPQNLAARIGIVAALADMGRLDDAGQAIGQLSEMAPKSIDVIHMRGKLALAEGDWEKARAVLQPHERALIENPSMRATYATVLLRAGQAAQALILLQELVEQNPAMREPRTLLAEAQLRSGEPGAALSTIRVLAMRPDARPEELKLASEAAAAAGDSSAKRYEGRIAAATPEWIGGELAKADAALRNKQWQVAADSYEAINDRSARPNAMVLNNLAFAKSQMGQSEQAAEIALQAVAIAPDHPAILDTAGWLLVDTGKDKARGLAMLQKASELAPQNTAIARRLRIAKSR